MCAIIGIVGKSPVAASIYEGLTVLQHRGQDATGIATAKKRKLYLHKANGLVRDVYHQHEMETLC